MQWLFWWQPPFLNQQVLINLVSDPDTALRGVLVRSRGAWLGLRRTFLVKHGAEPVPMDGEVLIHRSNVAFVQAYED